LALATYRGTPAHELAFETGSGGRPELAWSSGAPPIRFNLTHTPGLFAVSLTRRVACGVDAERLSTRAVDDSLLSAVLSPLELARLDTLARNEATAAFHRLWTRKEAVLKALGLGLKVDPRCVLVGDEDELAFVNDPTVEPRSRTGWQVRTFQPTPDHVVSVAIGSVTEALRPLLIELEPTFEAARRLD
jgi:4'-phosphopantetheinyl transferase